MRLAPVWTTLVATAALAEPPTEWLTIHEDPIEASEEVTGTCIAHIRLARDGTPKAVNVSGCDEALRVPVTERMETWTWVAPGDGVDVDLTYAIDFPGDGPAVVALDGPPVVHHAHITQPPTRRGSGPGMVALAQPGEPQILLTHTVPAKVPDALRSLGAGASVSCDLDVVLKKSGTAHTITPTTCPDGLRDAAISAVKRWRWTRSSDLAPSMKDWTTSVTVTVRVR